MCSQSLLRLFVDIRIPFTARIFTTTVTQLLGVFITSLAPLRWDVVNIGEGLEGRQT